MFLIAMLYHELNGVSTENETHSSYKYLLDISTYHI